MDDKTCGWIEYFSYHHEKLMWVPGCQSARGIASTYPGRSRICGWCGKATTDATDAANLCKATGEGEWAISRSPASPGLEST